MQIHGRCHCGSIRYQADVDPERTTICHCTDCQKLTGSAYRVSVPAEGGSFQLLAGTPTIYVKLGDSGARRAQAFCPNCGSPLYTYDADQEPKAYGLRVGCIEERVALVPRKQKWCRSALGWTDSLAGMERRDAE
ncbi:GFA family protein [Chitinimonas koreensis]|uniref:GFA family protein n=1 Tax=Chitinimonas koreensis TaxID=356302 RepID=UPI00041324EB|nr:GFA family protein [Chitinimonas koreensis]QNM97603.1 GFA family protein [Chitinimonas koreensis]